MSKLEKECVGEILSAYFEVTQKRAMPKDVFVNNLFKAHSAQPKFQRMLRQIVAHKDEPHSGNLRNSNSKPPLKKSTAGRSRFGGPNSVKRGKA